jgi:tetratricopeptide (TPR) repeat protein
VNRNFILACAAAIVLIAAAYAGSLHNSFHFDDSHVIETNSYIRSLRNIPLFFTDAHTFSSLPQNATYRPLVTLSLALDYAWGGGLEPRAFHLTQLALLLITGALIAAFFAPFAGRWPALLAATLFCIHTANTETMNLISARSELLSGIGLLASFLLYQRSPFARRTLLYLVPLAIGALAKAPLVVFAPLLFVYALLIEQHPPRRAARIALPSLILGVALLIFLNAMNAKEWVGGGGSALRYAMTQPFVWMHYARLFVLPIGLTADTDLQPFAQWYDTRAVAGYAFVLLLLWAIRRARGPIGFGLAWFAIALLPTSLFPLAEVSNEHRVFFAYVGLVLALVAWLPRRSLVPVMAVLIVANAIGTHVRNRVWQSEATLWADVVAKSPSNGRAWMNYGLTQMSHGDYAAARASYDRAAALTPNYWVLDINQGIVDGALGDHGSAERHFRRALELRPDANGHFFFARWLVERGRAPEALPHLREALRLSPAFGDARALLLTVADAAGLAERTSLLDATRRIDPNDAVLAKVEERWPSYDEALRAGVAAMNRRDWTAAAHANREALRHTPASADAWNNLGWALAQLGFRTEAADAYRRALALDPTFDRAANNLRLLR